MQEKRVVANRFFNQLLQQKELRTVDHSVNTLLECLHGRKGLERVAKEDDSRLASLIHGHLLHGLQREILGDVIGRETFFDNDDLISNLAETDEKVAVGRGGMDFIAQFGQRSAG